MLAAVRTKKVVPKPAQPEIDPRFKSVKNKIGQKSQQIKKHPPAKLKASEAAKAAVEPKNAKQAGAKEKQTDLMKAAKPEKVEPDNFRALLKAEIKKVMPETLDDADNFMEDGKEEQMKAQVSGKVSEQKNAAESNIKTTTKQKPNTAGVKEKEVENLPSPPPTPIPVVNAAEAMPVARTEAEISQEQSKRDADRQFKDAQITTPQLKKANDPRFTAVLDAKKEVEQTADASPAKYRAKEKTLLGQTAAKARSDGKRNLFALANVKIKSGAAVKSRQSAAKARDEAARKEVADNIEAMYAATKAAVETQLSTLEATVLTMFDNGSAAAIAEMKSNTEREIDDYKDDRYSGIRGKARWIADLFRATPKGIVVIINRNLEIFKGKMDALVDRVAETVDARLSQAKAEIDKGQAKIKNYVSGLKGSLKEIGKTAEKEVAGRFDEMRAGVEDRKNALAQKLAESYKSAVDKGNALASELEAENAGAAYKLGKKIAEIAQLILDFKDKLVAILKKAVSVILDILSDPIGFFGNLIDALGEGFSLFRKNFASNFKQAIARWLFGNLGGEGFELPKDLSAPSILKLAMGIAGLTYARIRAKAAKHIGERNVALLEKLYETLKALFANPAAFWEQAKEYLGNLEETVIGGIKKWLMTSLVEAGIKKLLTMFIPGGGFVQAAIAIYKIVVFIIERAAQIAEFISSVVDSVADIVKGAIGAAAKRIEQALIQALALIIDLLARLVGLSGIAATIKSLIKKVQDKVDNAIEKVIAKIVQTVKKLFGRTGKESAKTVAANEVVRDADAPFSFGGESHTLRLSNRNGGIAYLMASGNFGEIQDKLNELSKSYAEPYRTGGLPDIADKVDKKINAIKKKMLKAEKDSNRRVKNISNVAGNQSAEIRKDAFAASAVLHDDLEKLAKDFTKGSLGKELFGKAAKLKIGDTVQLLSPAASMLVTEVKKFGDLHGKQKLFFKAESADRSYKRAFDYQDEGKVWKLANKPGFRAFLSGGLGGINSIRIDKANLDSGSAASSNPPWWKQYLGKRFFAERGHLIAKVLGGPGGSNNIVPLTNKANDQMSVAEKKISQDIRKTDGVYDYSAQAKYPNNDLTQPPDEVNTTATKIYPDKTPTTKTGNFKND